MRLFTTSQFGSTPSGCHFSFCEDVLDEAKRRLRSFWTQLRKAHPHLAICPVSLSCGNGGNGHDKACSAARKVHRFYCAVVRFNDGFHNGKPQPSAARAALP